MKTDEIRERFLRFFTQRGHTLVPSDLLVPTNDPTLLFTGAGMNQFKPLFLGLGKAPYTRATSCQKCFRTADLDLVGRTAAHQTFFEMLGNFSFGDYFKREAIEWAWEFFTRDLNLPQERLGVSVFEKDDEAFEIWSKHIGLPVQRILRLGEDTNFWPANAPSQGPDGPCGPCSEIYYDLGKEHGCGLPNCNFGCNCNRYVEVWNLVFMEFERKGEGTLIPLPKKNIDTGMGLERLAAVLQNVSTTFHIDIIFPILEAITDCGGPKYEANSETGARMRRIADHVRAATFLLADGVKPSNEGAGYVHRKLIRRAADDGAAIGIKNAFLFKLVPVVARLMRKPYPEIESRAATIARFLKAEEEKYIETVEEGSRRLDEIVRKLRGQNVSEFPGSLAFMLYDTYGLPPEKTESLLARYGMTMDQEGFRKAMETQRERAMAASNIVGSVFAMSPLAGLKGTVDGTLFVGYDRLESPGKVVGILANEELLDELHAPAEAMLLLDATCFYGEAGGQVGDRGRIVGAAHGEMEFVVENTVREDTFILHKGKLTRGWLRLGDEVRASVDEAHRRAVARAHTGTHLLQNALRTVLGKHVEQAGSLVAPDRLRFDFSHFQALTADELSRIEELVNARVIDNAEVLAREESFSDAKSKGALTVPGEKYADRVRAVYVGDYSLELCGGTHVRRTGDIGLFIIASSSAVAAGVRRIEAYTGLGAYREIARQRALLVEAAAAVRSVPNQLRAKLDAMLEETRNLKREIDRLKRGETKKSAEEAITRGRVVNGERFVAEKYVGVTVEELRQLADVFVKKERCGAALLMGLGADRVSVILAVRRDIAEAKKADASVWLRDIVACVGGSGGGRAEMAQGGFKDASRTDAAIQRFWELVAQIVHEGHR